MSVTGGGATAAVTVKLGTRECMGLGERPGERERKISWGKRGTKGVEGMGMAPTRGLGRVVAAEPQRKTNSMHSDACMMRLLKFYSISRI